MRHKLNNEQLLYNLKLNIHRCNSDIKACKAFKNGSNEKNIKHMIHKLLIRKRIYELKLKNLVK